MANQVQKTYKKLRFLIDLETPIREKYNLIGLIIIALIIFIYSMYCGKSKIPLGSKVKIIKNIGNKCEPFLSLTGIACNPFKRGSNNENWIGVHLNEETIYGRKFNFHIKEIEIYE